MPLVGELKNLLRFWLQGCGVPSSGATAISDRFPTYFVYALNEEWRKNPTSYRPLTEALDTPFAKAAARESAWLAYQALLQKRVQESVFDEPFSLAQIFIPLNAYYFDQKPKKDSQEQTMRHQNRPRVVVRLQEELEDWAQNGRAEDALRIISGGPGSGKSSFARILAASLAAKNKKVLFIPLHLIDADKGVVAEVGRYLQDEGVLTENPIDTASPEFALTIVFDGLDELASQGKAAAETARSFVREVEKTIERRNIGSVKLRVLISGRELAVQENESEFRRLKQVLFLLPYFVSQESAGTSSDREQYKDPQGVLEIDLRDQWWQTYGRLTERSYKGLPEQLARPELQEITEQPLLNYLLALSFTRGIVNFEQEINLNVIYADLVEAVHERAYEKGRQYAPIRRMELKDFSRVLEEIGLAAWHGDGRTTTVREIEDHCKLSGVGRLLEVFKEGAQEGITRLLAAFFFRRHGVRDSGDQTFVFTHKSFGEYLAARRIVRAVEKIVRELHEREQDTDRGWDQKEALKHWAQLCGPTAISPYLHSFLIGEIALRSQEEIKVWQLKLARLFSHLLRVGMPMEEIQTTSFHRAMFQSRNAEEALLALLNACALATKAISAISLPETTSFGEWFKRIQGQRGGTGSYLAARCLSYLELEGASMAYSDFHGANLAQSNLRNVDAVYTNMVGADLSEADLSSAYLSSANLSGANLSGANLSSAYLSSANLSSADLSSADLRGANLSDANLSDANLSDANLRGANLRGANLSDADLSRANLSSADLSDANLSSADLRGANLRGANLSRANLSRANLSEANLSRSQPERSQPEPSQPERSQPERSQPQKHKSRTAHKERITCQNLSIGARSKTYVATYGID